MLWSNLDVEPHRVVPRRGILYWRTSSGVSVREEFELRKRNGMVEGRSGVGCNEKERRNTNQSLRRSAGIKSRQQ